MTWENLGKALTTAALAGVGLAALAGEQLCRAGKVLAEKGEVYVEQGKKYCIYADTGATEHLVCVNGEKAGMLDFVAHAADAPSRIHRYFLPSTLNNGDRVTLEAYYSHPIPGTMPYDGTSTFSLDGLYPDRPFEEAGIAEMYLPLYDFCQKLA